MLRNPIPLTALTRRDFLKFAAVSATLPWLAGAAAGRAAASPASPASPAPIPGLGRVTSAVKVRDTPTPSGVDLGTYAFDTVVGVLAAVEGEGLWAHNPTWYQTADGYVYSSFVQPVEDAPQPVEWNVPAQGFWAEVNVPFVDALGRPEPGSLHSYRLYYGSAYRVVNITADANGVGWYGLAEWHYPHPSFYVPATALRRIWEAELEPIAPGADKLIKVNLTTNWLEAYENGAPVFSTRIASGTIFNINGRRRDFRTPTGNFRVLRKSAGSHMKGGTRGWDYYDLPGVPFCTYITPSAVAVHGAYWHNDYGAQRSHGCLNVLPHAARWVYRWTEPFVPYDTRQLFVGRGLGTRFEIAY